MNGNDKLFEKIRQVTSYPFSVTCVENKGYCEAKGQYLDGFHFTVKGKTEKEALENLHALLKMDWDAGHSI